MSSDRIKIVWIYPDLLSTYGDQGNTIVLERRAALRGIRTETVNLRSDEPVPADGDIYLLGGGEDRPQILAAQRLLGAVLLAWMRPNTTGSRVARALRTAAADLRSGLFSRRNGPGIVLASAVVVAGHLATFLVAARAAGATAPLSRP